MHCNARYWDLYRVKYDLFFFVMPYITALQQKVIHYSNHITFVTRYCWPTTTKSSVAGIKTYHKLQKQPLSDHQCRRLAARGIKPFLCPLWGNKAQHRHADPSDHKPTHTHYPGTSSESCIQVSEHKKSHWTWWSTWRSNQSLCWSAGSGLH